MEVKAEKYRIIKFGEKQNEAKNGMQDTHNAYEDLRKRKRSCNDR